MFEKVMKSARLITLPEIYVKLRGDLIAIASNHPIRFLVFLVCWVGFGTLYAQTGAITVRQSVEQAINYSPKLKALVYKSEAIAYDLKQARGRYLPTVDIMAGYGLEQHSDSVTRLEDAIPGDTDWDPKESASLKITQKLYDGGETGHQISIQEALLDSASYYFLDATQGVALDAISAHLDVYRQRKLVALAENNLKVHQDIYQQLAEGAKAGAVSIADVTQTQARMARARSTLRGIKADLNRAVANYTRLVGEPPEELSYAQAPEEMPASLDEALLWAEQKNPEILSLKAELAEADAEIGLTRSAYKPDVNIELSSQYYDQLEGDTSWQNTSEAMLVLRWNLFNGGQDKAKNSAALSRRSQVAAELDHKRLEIRESTTSVWSDHASLKDQKEMYQDAVAFSKETFEAYMKQFSVSRRDLLDVLSAESDYFQSAVELITVSVDEIVAGYRIMRLGGRLETSIISANQGVPEVFSGLSDLQVFPPTE